MEQLTKALRDSWARLKDWANRLEESAYYERAIAKYDSLEPTQAKRLARAAAMAAGVALAFLYIYPLWSVVSLRWDLRSYRHLLADMESLNANYKPQAKKSYTPPAGWQNLPAENQDEFLTSVDQFLAQIGTIPELTKVSTQGNETSINFQEISIKQAVSLLFQLEGWYPGVKILRSQIGAHPQSKELLTMQVAFRYEGPGASGLRADPNMNLPSDDAGFEAVPGMDNPPPANISNPPRMGNPSDMQAPPESFGQDGDEFDVPPPPPPPPVMDDFGQDMPPPLEEDL